MMMPNTAVSIIASDFLVNGRRTYEGRVYRGLRVEGLLFNSRMVQAIFDDLDPATCRLPEYADHLGHRHRPKTSILRVHKTDQRRP
jgi:hypothetical protein